MDLSLQASPLFSVRHDRHRLLTRPTRLSLSQLGILARKLDRHQAFFRCDASKGGGGSVEEKEGARTVTVESADDTASGSWMESGGNADPYSGWISTASQQAKASNVAGWMTIGSVLFLTLGFTLGARSLYSNRGRQLTVGPPATEEHAICLKTTEIEDTAQNLDQDESTGASEKVVGGSKGAKQQLGEQDAFEPQIEDDEAQLPGSLQKNGPENEIVETSGINDDLASSFLVDKSGEIDGQPKPLEVSNQDPLKQTSDTDAAAATEGNVSPVGAQSIEITEKDTTPLFIYANEDEIGAVLGESDVSDSFLREESAQDESLSPSHELYEGLHKKTSVFEEYEQLTGEGDDGKSASQKDFASVELGDGSLPATLTAPSTPLKSSASSLGEVVVPAHVNHMQEQILAALQGLKVIEADVKAGDICTRREYARWLMSASALLSRSIAYKVLPAMYMDNVSVLAYEDVAPNDKDFPFIQGLAEAGLLSSKLIEDHHHNDAKEISTSVFSPDSYLTRQDLVTWKVALERKPVVTEGNPNGTELMALQEVAGFIDLDKIHKDALPALLMDMNAGEQSIVALAFGHTRRLQPQKPVTKGQAAVALATGEAWELVSEELARLEAESVAEAAVVAEMALEAKTEEEVAVAYEKLLQAEREKRKESASMVESLRSEFEHMKTVHETEKLGLLRDAAAIEAERHLLSRIRLEVEQQASALSSAKMEAAFQQEKTEKLLKEAEQERSSISNVRRELEIEKNALILARSWAEDEASKAQEQSKFFEQTRKQLEREGQAIPVNVDKDLDANLKERQGFEETRVAEIDNTSSEISKVDTSVTDRLLDKSKEAGQMLMDSFVRFFRFLQLMFHMVIQRAIDLYRGLRGKFHEVRANCADSTARTVNSFKQTAPASVAGFSSSAREGTLKIFNDLKGGAEKFSQKFKAP